MFEKFDYVVPIFGRKNKALSPAAKVMKFLGEGLIEFFLLNGGKRFNFPLGIIREIGVNVGNGKVVCTFAAKRRKKIENDSYTEKSDKLLHPFISPQVG
jgi:hypothetical protein